MAFPAVQQEDSLQDDRAVPHAGPRCASQPAAAEAATGPGASARQLVYIRGRLCYFELHVRTLGNFVRYDSRTSFLLQVCDSFVSACQDLGRRIQATFTGERDSSEHWLRACLDVYQAVFEMYTKLLGDYDRLLSGSSRRDVVTFKRFLRAEESAVLLSLQ